uniref:MYND-type domain-containing protein n=1 Tax=viral metagenome TaxID=1070528 RepID=A0A6C0CG84_9ZZZZ
MKATLAKKQATLEREINMIRQELVKMQLEEGSLGSVLEMALGLRSRGQIDAEIELLSSFLKPPLEALLKLEDRSKIYTLLADAHDFLEEFKEALDYVVLEAECTAELYGKQSENYALVLEKIVLSQHSCNLYVESRLFLTEAISIWEKLHKTNHVNFYRLLFLSGSVEMKAEHYFLAIGYYTRAKAGLQKSDSDFYSTLLVCMDLCHRSLNQWNEAYEVCLEKIAWPWPEKCERIRSLIDMYTLYVCLKQYELAEQILGTAFTLNLESGESPERFDMTTKLYTVQIMKSMPHREKIEVGHDHRMCNVCRKIFAGMEACGGCYKVWYCGEKCQLEHWSVHKSDCTVCFNCEQVIDRDAKFLRCSTCKSTKYCSRECQKADWKEHKKTCK